MSKLTQFWIQAGKDLELKVESPFQLTLPSGGKLVVQVLVKDFGAKNGMLIVSDYGSIKSYTDHITEMGFGFSSMSDYSDDQTYNVGDFIEVLKDWGWSGEPGTEPDWLKNAS